MIVRHDSIEETCEALRTLPYAQPNLEIHDRAETTSLEAMILKAQLHWAGHVIRMNEDMACCHKTKDLKEDHASTSRIV